MSGGRCRARASWGRSWYRIFLVEVTCDMSERTVRRLVGIDLGIASQHTVRVLDGDGNLVKAARCVPAVASLTVLEQTALAGTPAGTVLEVVFEPTGPAWFPIAVFFSARGHRVFRVSSAKASDLRKFFRKHAKSNGIDADTLARLPLVDPAGLRQLELAEAGAAALDRRVRACDRLTQAATAHKVRIKDLARQLMPMTPLTADLGQADLAVLERYADPRALVKTGETRLTRLITKVSHGQQGAERAAEVATEVCLLKAITAELAAHATEREKAYLLTDTGQLARSLPGFGQIGAPALVAGMGRPGRFADGAHFKSYTGLAPKASETGETDRKGEPMSKAGPSLLRTTLIRAADHARKVDPQLARIYWIQMTERGAGHLKACCVTAAHLAERAWAVMHRGTPYVICDNDGNPVTPEQAKKIIAEKWTVPEDVRKRRRSGKQKGKAPQQAPAGPGKRGDLPRPRSSRLPRLPVKRSP